MRRGLFPAVLASVLTSVGLLVGACTSTPPNPASEGARTPLPTGVRSPSSAPAAGVDWPTFGGNNARTGLAAADFPAMAAPAIRWKADLDGPVYGQPLVIGARVLAATENDTVYALDPGDGSVLWARHVGTPISKSALPCGNIDPLGITGTMAYDPASGTVFAVAETSNSAHTLYGFDVATGEMRLERNVDPPKGDRVAHQQRSALTVLDGRVYVAYGGLFGDCGQYIGSVVSVPTSGDGPSAAYAVPTTREAGIWAPGGGVTTTDGHLLYAVGNGESVSAYDGSDSVISLTRGLRLADRFSPRTWAEDNAQDLDLGSMSPAIVGDRVYANGKRATGYLLDATRLGGIGGEISQVDTCPAFGASAVDGDTLYVPCADGTRAIRIGSDGSMAVLWHTDAGTDGSPIVGGGDVWAMNTDSGVLCGLDPATGKARVRVDIGRVPHFATPTLARGAIYVGTVTGVTALH